MAQVTIQLIEGLERGSMFRDIPTPVTIGREDENAIRLNDERVSRFHAKIQEDDGQLILTDLESTNGTRVNGHPTQMRVLQVGDQIAIGRCLLIFGSPEQINARAEALIKEGNASQSNEHTLYGNRAEDGTSFAANSAEGSLSYDDELGAELFANGPPAAPSGLRPLQRAQVSDMLGYCHAQIRRVLNAAQEQEDSRRMGVSWQEWQRLVRLEMDLAVCMRKVADPDG